jgi:predicted nicotinamide N-methyase
MPSLEHDLTRRYDLRTHHFRHGWFEAELIAPRAPDELIDVSEFNVDERLPYWADLWPSARALAAELLDMPFITGRVLELGCGIALPSLALRSRGVEVVASDYYAEALEFARANAVRNSIEPPPTMLLDWRDPPPDVGRFELLVAADVLYERRNAEALSRLIPLLAASDARALVADPGRSHVDHFRSLMQAQGWSMEETARRTEPAPGGSGLQVNIRLYSLWRGLPKVIDSGRSCTRS